MLTDRSKLIIWLTTQFPNGKFNRNGIFIYRTVKYLSGHLSIKVVNLYSRTPPYLVMLKKAKDAGSIYSEWKQRFPSSPVKPDDAASPDIEYIKYFRLPRGRFDYLEKEFVYGKVKKYVEQFICQYEEVIIHSNWLFPESSLAEKLSKELGIKFVISLRGGDIRELEPGSKNFSEAVRILNSAEKIGAVTADIFREAAEKRITLDKNKLFLLRNYYDTGAFEIRDRAESKKMIGESPDSKMIFYAGTLRKLKNVESLIKAYGVLKESIPGLKLFIAGSGMEEGSLKKLASETSKADITFTGNLDSSEMARYYNAADIFCLPSFNEGLPNVCVEALLCGTPVVASNVGGTPDVIKDGQNGFLFDPSDIDQIVTALERGLMREWDREALKSSVSEFLPENLLKTYSDFYDL
jgi:glycosyltransferase involved in cell wall biosynthesis